MRITKKKKIKIKKITEVDSTIRGGFIQGLNSDPRYNLTFIVKNSVAMGKPIIAASINYRLGGFGFLDSPQLREAGLSNLGLRDQRLALHWVQVQSISMEYYYVHRDANGLVGKHPWLWW